MCMQQDMRVDMSAVSNIDLASCFLAMRVRIELTHMVYYTDRYELTKMYLFPLSILVRLSHL